MPSDETASPPSAPGAEGVLLGLACGDALGQPVEGWSADRIAAEYGTLDTLVGGTRGLGAGAWTDDTEQAVRLSRSLVERGRFDPDDVADRFLAWYRGGATGIGGLTRAVLRRMDAGEHWSAASRREWERRPEGTNAGNGSVMRCAPVAIAFADADAPLLAAASRASSRLTHHDPRCVYGCELLNQVVAGFLRDGDADSGGDEPFDVLDGALATLPDDAPDELGAALTGLHGRDPNEIRPTGYVLDTLKAGLYHGLGAPTLEQAIVDAVNMGGDTDTIGAVAGAVAGARFSASQVPDRWLEELHGTDELRGLARRLDARSYQFDRNAEG